jgi:hypothetical protein
MDDMMTAYVALQEAAAINQATAAAAAASSPAATVPAGRISHTLDIGCGIGSVLLMVAWGLRRQHMEQKQKQQQQRDLSQQQQLASYSVTACGVEAQAVSFQLARRSIRYNLGQEEEQQVQVRVIVWPANEMTPGQQNKVQVRRVTLKVADRLVFG